MTGISVLIRGRPAWIAGLVLGVILLVVGVVLEITGLIIAGAGLGLFALVFLILSFVTGGATD